MTTNKLKQLIREEVKKVLKEDDEEEEDEWIEWDTDKVAKKIQQITKDKTIHFINDYDSQNFPLFNSDNFDEDEMDYWVDDDGNIFSGDGWDNKKIGKISYSQYKEK